MRDLLTRGIDAEGHIRYSRIDNFKPSHLGQIPETWEVVTVEKAGSVTIGRQRSPAHQNGPFMTSYLRVANVFDSGTEHHILPDVVLSLNGLPIAVIECKSPKVKEPIPEAIDQMLRYSQQRGDSPEGNAELFYYNQFRAGRRHVRQRWKPDQAVRVPLFPPHAGVVPLGARQQSRADQKPSALVENLDARYLRAHDDRREDCSPRLDA